MAPLLRSADGLVLGVVSYILRTFQIFCEYLDTTPLPLVRYANGLLSSAPSRIAPQPSSHR